MYPTGSCLQYGHVTVIQNIYEDFTLKETFKLTNTKLVFNKYKNFAWNT